MTPSPMNDHDAEFTATSVTAISNDTFHTSRQPVRVAWEPYGRPHHGDADPNATSYRRIDGHAVHKDGYLYIECINGDEYIIAPGTVFAPSKTEWYGEDVTRQFESPEEDLPPTPFADQQWVIGAVDGDTCTAIGINTVLLVPENPNSSRYGVCNVTDVVSEAMADLESFSDGGEEHALETVDNAYKKLDRARKALNGEYKEILVTGIPTRTSDHSEQVTFTHPE